MLSFSSSEFNCQKYFYFKLFGLVKVSYPSAEVQSEYSTAPADWAKKSLGLPSTQLHITEYDTIVHTRVKEKASLFSEFVLMSLWSLLSD